MLRAAIFDMDGLLLDTERAAVDAWALAAAELKLVLPLAVVLDTVGRDWDATQKIIMESIGEGVSFPELRELVLHIYRQGFINRGVPAKPGAEHLLRRLREAGIPVGLATSTERTSAEWKMQSAGLFQYLSGSACGDEVLHGKPAPDVFLLSASNIDVSPAQCAALEDSPAGIMAAKAAGMTAIMVPDMVPPSEDILKIADYVAKDLFEAGDILFELFKM